MGSVAAFIYIVIFQPHWRVANHISLYLCIMTRKIIDLFIHLLLVFHLSTVTGKAIFHIACT